LGNRPEDKKLRGMMLMKFSARAQKSVVLDDRKDSHQRVPERSYYLPAITISERVNK